MFVNNLTEIVFGKCRCTMSAQGMMQDDSRPAVCFGYATPNRLCLEYTLAVDLSLIFRDSTLTQILFAPNLHHSVYIFQTGILGSSGLEFPCPLRHTSAQTRCSALNISPNSPRLRPLALQEPH